MKPKLPTCCHEREAKLVNIITIIHYLLFRAACLSVGD